MGKCTERLYNGIVKENPTFVQMLGMCPTLAVTSSAINGAGMGLSTTCILVLSNAFISLLRKVIPDKVRIPSYIVIIASFVTVIQFLMQAYLPSLNDSLGIYIPLIVVNCIILGRAESYASKNKVLPSIFDGLGMGLGFTIGLTLIGMFRELIGKGCVFGFQIIGDGNLLQKTSGAGKTIGDVLAAYTPITIFVLAPGAFLVLSFLTALQNKLKMLLLLQRSIREMRRRQQRHLQLEKRSLQAVSRNPVWDVQTSCVQEERLLCRILRLMFRQVPARHPLHRLRQHRHHSRKRL